MREGPPRPLRGEEGVQGRSLWLGFGREPGGLTGLATAALSDILWSGLESQDTSGLGLRACRRSGELQGNGRNGVLGPDPTSAIWRWRALEGR